MNKPNILLTSAVASLLTAAQAGAAAPAGVDTSEWKCESCPFQTTYEADSDVGVLYVDEDSARFGRYNGLDEKGAYADVNAYGGSRSESGVYYSYDLIDLGLDTREAELSFGKEGTIEGRLSYDGLVHRVWDTTVTPFSLSGGDTLTLPSGWVRSATTAGMTALSGSLSPINIGTERRALGAGLKYLLGTQLEFFADYSRQEIEGNRLNTASFLIQALEYAEPVDAAHDQIEIGAMYRFGQGYARLSYYASDYDNALSSITFDNPYVPIAVDTVTGRKALAPDNKADLVALDGNFLLPWWDGVLSYRVAEGSMKQDQTFLPLSTSAALNATGVVPRGNLGGDVSTSRYRASLSLRPHPRLRGRVSYRYDERDDGTAVYTAPYVATDSAPAGPDTALRFGYERTQLDAFGEVKVLDWLYVGGGIDGDEIKRSNQASSKTDETRTYGQLRMRPWGTVEFTGRYGESHIDAGTYVVNPLLPPENPLLRKYNQTNRDRDFAEARLSWSPWKLSFALQGIYNFDAYRLSALGLKSGRDYQYAGTVSWAVTDAASVYLTGSYQNIATEQAGSESFAATAAPWTVSHEDEFQTVGTGAAWRDIGGKVDLMIDYTYGRSQGDIITGVSSPAVGGAFPRLKTELNSVRLSASYDVNDRLSVGAAWTWEDYSSSDWQLAGVEPATLPTLLSLSADPYDYSVNVIGVSFSYRFGKRLLEDE